MLWENFIIILKAAEQRFEQIIDDLPQYHSFLKKSSPVISFGAIQIPLKKELSVLDLKSMFKLLKDSMVKANLLALNDLIERLEDDQKVMVKQKRTEGLKELTEKLASAKTELNTFPLKELEVHESFDIFVVFPSINIEAIQAIKSHSLMNQEKVCRCSACIRAYLY